jgi:hypothetical protein
MPKLAEVDMKHNNDQKRKMSKDSVLSNKSNQSGNSNNSDSNSLIKHNYKMTYTYNISDNNTNTVINQSQHTSFQLNWLTTSSTFNSDDEIKKYVYEKPDSISRWTE